MPETEQLLPSTNGYYDLPKNKDGSIDIWFGPKQPDGMADAAFIQTVPKRHFLVALRLYGTGVVFYDQSWKPCDLVKRSSNAPAHRNEASGNHGRSYATR